MVSARGMGWRPGARFRRYPPRPTFDEALFSQRSVASSLQPGTAKRAGGDTFTWGRSTAGWRARA